MSSKGQSVVVAYNALTQRHLGWLARVAQMSPLKSGCCWLCRNKIFGLIIENLLGITSQHFSGHIVAKVWLHALSFVLERSCRQSKHLGSMVRLLNHVPLCRESQVELREQIDNLATELCRINEDQKVALDLDPYVKKLLNARRRVVLVNNILQNAQERLRRLNHSVAKETARRRAMLDSGVYPPGSPSK